MEQEHRTVRVVDRDLWLAIGVVSGFTVCVLITVAANHSPVWLWLAFAVGSVVLASAATWATHPQLADSINAHRQERERTAGDT